MDINEAIFGRHSTRDYTDQALDQPALRRLIDAAIQAPSAVNLQPWTFTVVRDQSLLDRISHDAKAHMLATMPVNAQSSHFRSMLGDAAYHIFYHAPALILISATAPGQWIVEDCALAAENLMLAAHGDGLGSCWIGFAQSFLNTPQGRNMLGLAPDSVPVAPIIVGHPKTTPAAVPRKEPEIRWID
jgi:nitroreductase